VRILCDLGLGRKAALFGEPGHGKRPIGNTVRIAQAMVMQLFQATSSLPLNSREPSNALRIRHPSTRRF
jgi:hypothetical protein